MRELIEYHGITEFIPGLSDSYKTVNLQGTKALPKDYALIEYICKFGSMPVILDISVKPTPVSNSTTGQKLSGYKVNFNGHIKSTLEYSSINTLSSINIFEFNHEFTEYIILPHNFLESSKPNIVCYVHDLNIFMLDHDKFFYNICVTFNAEF